MDFLLLVAFVTTTFLFVLVPGPSVAFATAQAVRHGYRAAVVAVAGDALGTVVHISVAVAGLATLIALSEIILPFLQIAGGLFIIMMALQSFRNRSSQAPSASVAKAKVTFWAGFFACVTNPKAIVFFVALFPSFISPDHSVLLQSIIYGVIFLVLDGISILAYAYIATVAMRRATSRWLSVDMLSALGLLGVGGAMIVKGYRALPTE